MTTAFGIRAAVSTAASRGAARRRVVGEGAVEGDGVGVDQELRRVEPEAALGRVGAVGAQAVAGAGRRAPATVAAKTPVGVAVERDAVVSRVAVEEAEPDALGGARPDGEAQAVRGRAWRRAARAAVGDRALR